MVALEKGRRNSEDSRNLKAFNFITRSSWPIRGMESVSEFTL